MHGILLLPRFMARPIGTPCASALIVSGMVGSFHRRRAGGATYLSLTRRTIVSESHPVMLHVPAVTVTLTQPRPKRMRS